MVASIFSNRQDAKTAKKPWRHKKNLGVLRDLAVQIRKFGLLVFPAFEEICDSSIEQEYTDCR